MSALTSTPLSSLRISRYCQLDNHSGHIIWQERTQTKFLASTNFILETGQIECNTLSDLEADNLASDPAVLAWAVYMDFFTPEVVFNAFVSKSISTRNPYQDFCLDQLGGASLMLAIIDIFLLRYTEDVHIWKILQTAVLTYDCALLYSSFHALAQQERLSASSWRFEDWGCIIITFQAMVVRTLFLLGVGLAQKDRTLKKA